jgi:ribonuclease P protein component
VRPPDRREVLRGEADFTRVFRDGRRLGTGRIQLFVAPTQRGGGKVGYVIGRRQLPRAVDRNRLRRMLRETLRRRRGVTRDFDIVVRLLKGCARAELASVAAEAAALLDGLATAFRR